MASRLSYAIVRPTVTFGLEDILINSIAWLLRRFPVFAIPGSGEYRLQPIYVEDVTEIAVTAGQEARNLAIDAAGPEVYTFDELVRLLAEKIGRRAEIVRLPPAVAPALARAIGWTVRDVVLTREEIAGLMANLLISSAPPPGKTRPGDWLGREGGNLGAQYASERNRHDRS